MKTSTLVALAAAGAVGVAYYFFVVKRAAAAEPTEGDPGFVGPPRLSVGHRHRLVYHLSGAPDDPAFFERMRDVLERSGATDVSFEDGDPVVLEFVGPPAITDSAPLDPLRIGPVVADLQFIEVLP